MRKHLFIALMLGVLTTTNSQAENDFSSFTYKTARIVGGVKSVSNSWPSIVALLNTAKYNQELLGNNPEQAKYQAQSCGGTLVASKWVLTAAHCVVNINNGVVLEPSAFTALVGTLDLLNGGELKSIKKIIVHPDFDHNTLDSDVALLELNVKTLESIIAIAPETVSTNAAATAVGWGNRSSVHGVEDYPAEAFEVTMPVIARSTCATAFNPYPSKEFTDNMICAGLTTGGKDACQGDSGGPLFATFNNESVLVGVTSWGIGCAQPSLYGVYTRVFNYKGWIDSKLFEEPSGSGGSIFFILIPFTLILLVRRRNFDIKKMRKLYE